MSRNQSCLPTLAVEASGRLLPLSGHSQRAPPIAVTSPLGTPCPKQLGVHMSTQAPRHLCPTLSLQHSWFNKHASTPDRPTDSVARHDCSKLVASFPSTPARGLIDTSQPQKDALLSIQDTSTSIVSEEVLRAAISTHFSSLKLCIRLHWINSKIARPRCSISHRGIWLCFKMVIAQGPALGKSKYSCSYIKHRRLHL